MSENHVILYTILTKKTQWEALMLEGKTVILGVTGSIAAYKIASLASMLKK